MSKPTDTVRILDEVRDLWSNISKVCKDRDGLLSDEHASDAEVVRLESLVKISHETIERLEALNGEGGRQVNDLQKNARVLVSDVADLRDRAGSLKLQLERSEELNQVLRNSRSSSEAQVEIERLQAIVARRESNRDLVADELREQIRHLEKETSAAHIDHQMFKANLGLLTELDEAKRTSTGHWDAYMKASRERDDVLSVSEAQRAGKIEALSAVRFAHETIRLITRDGTAQQRHLDLIEQIHEEYKK